MMSLETLHYPTMSNEPLEWDLDARGLKFAIIVARFHREITGRLLDGAREALTRAGAENFQVFDVPGAFELPLAAKKIAKKIGENGYHAVIALGAVIRGETSHFEYIAAEAARGLQQVALENEMPVAFGVLTTDTYEQAAARAGGALGNKGFDAAMTAIEMVRLLERVQPLPR